MTVSPDGHWRITGFRNRIIHEYTEPDPEIVRFIFQNEIPRLLEEIEALLAESGSCW